MVEDDDREPVLLDLGPAVERVDESLEDRGIDLTDDDPMDEVGEVVALRHSQIDEVRETVDHAGGLVSTLPMVAIALITTAVVLAVDRRRMLARAGVGIVVAMVVTAVAPRVARRAATADGKDGVAGKTTRFGPNRTKHCPWPCSSFLPNLVERSPGRRLRDGLPGQHRPPFQRRRLPQD